MKKVVITPSGQVEVSLTQYEIDERTLEITNNTENDALRNAQELIYTMRTKRNQLLAESDYTQLPDAPITASQLTAYNTYRQELRDLPSLYPDGVDVIYPVKPV